MPAHDVLILGGGPAGLALAAESARLGLKTALLEAQLHQPWPRSYGSWADNLASTWDTAIGRSFATARVVLPEGASTRVAANYVRFDTPRLQSLLVQRSREAGAQLIEGCFEQAAHQPASTLACFSNSKGERRTLDARVVVDARGRRADRRDGRVAFQSAFGGWFDVGQHDLPADEIVLMDYRPACAGRDDGPPSFLYAAPEARGVLFAQETVLVSERPVPMALLEQRLRARLARMGVRDARLREEERCVIAMGGRLPGADSALLPFGAAAGFVHPATGYSLARSLAAAGPTADAIARGLSEEGARGARRALVLGHTAIWPRSARQAHHLYQLGLSCMLGFQRPELGAFLRAFFALPPRALTAFMDGTLSGSAAARAMWSVFRGLPMPLRYSLLRQSSRELPLLHAALTGGTV